MNLRKEFEKETSTRKPITRTHEAYAYYCERYAEWLEAKFKLLNLACVMGCHTQDNVLEILENATDLKDAIAIVKEGNDGDNNP